MVQPIGRQYDVNSQLGGFLGDWAWQCSGQGATAPPHSIHTEASQHVISGKWPGQTATQANKYAAFDAIDANKDLSAAGVWARYYQAPTSSPAGSVRFELDAKLPSGVGSGTAYIQVMAANQVTLLAQTQITLSGVWQTGAATLAVTAGTAYWIRVYVVGSRALLGRVRAVPVSPSDGFWTQNFVRYTISKSELSDNSAFGGNGLAGDDLDNQHYYADPESSFTFATDTTKMFVETYNNFTQFNGGWIDVLVNGMKWTKLRGTVNTVDIVECDLPDGAKTVSLVNGGQLWGGADLRFVQGAWAKAVYVLQSDSFTPQPPAQSSDVVVLYGNSKLAGFYAGGTDDNLDAVGGGIPANLRAAMSSGRVIQKAIGSRSLAKDYAAGGNSVIDLARQVLTARPTHIIWEPLRNDWGGVSATAPWASVAAWSTQFKTLIDFIKTANPSIQQWFLYTTHENSEAANASGQTLAAFLTELDVIFTDRQTGGSAAYVVPPKKIDCRTLWSTVQAGADTTYCVDGVHPSSFGYGLIAKQIRTSLGR